MVSRRNRDRQSWNSHIKTKLKTELRLELRVRILQLELEIGFKRDCQNLQLELGLRITGLDRVRVDGVLGER